MTIDDVLVTARVRVIREFDRERFDKSVNPASSGDNNDRPSLGGSRDPAPLIDGPRCMRVITPVRDEIIRLTIILVSPSNQR